MDRDNVFVWAQACATLTEPVENVAGREFRGILRPWRARVGTSCGQCEPFCQRYKHAYARIRRKYNCYELESILPHVILVALTSCLDCRIASGEVQGTSMQAPKLRRILLIV